MIYMNLYVLCDMVLFVSVIQLKSYFVIIIKCFLAEVVDSLLQCQYFCGSLMVAILPDSEFQSYCPGEE